MFIDASALCAILLAEPDSAPMGAKLSEAAIRMTSAVAVFETAQAIARESGGSLLVARQLVARFLHQATIDLVEIGAAESEIALDAAERFGKGRHPARLNMSDCFAYACARSHGVPLLFKGDDFSQTDIERA